MRDPNGDRSRTELGTVDVELADRWGLSLSAVYQGKSDVYLLKRVYFGKSLRFLRQQVIQVEEEKLGVFS